MGGNLMSSRVEISKRIEEKRQRVADWLIAEVYSDYGTMAGVLGVTPATAYKTLVAMEADDLVERHQTGRGSVWSMTMTGQLSYLAEDGDASSLFDPRVSEVTIKHTLALQRLRLRE